MSAHPRLVTLGALFAALLTLVGCGGAKTSAPSAANPSPSVVATASAGGQKIATFPTNTAAASAKNAVPEIGIVEPGRWFNSQPLTLAGLHGTAVMLVFWSDI